MSDSNKQDCTQIGEMLGAFRDMELSLPEVELVESHLSDCPACRRELEEIEKVVNALQSLPAVPEIDFSDAIEDRINRLATSSPNVEPPVSKPTTLVPVASNVIQFPAKRSSWRPMAAAAALLLVGFVAALTFAPRPVNEVAIKPAHKVEVATASSERKALSAAGGKSAAALNEDIVALYEDEGANNNATDVGISTNEDGLYAIKM